MRLESDVIAQGRSAARAGTAGRTFCCASTHRAHSAPGLRGRRHKTRAETRAGTFFNLAVLRSTDHAQSACPEYFYVVTPVLTSLSMRIRVNAYFRVSFRLLRRRSAFVEGDDDALVAKNYPEPLTTVMCVCGRRYAVQSAGGTTISIARPGHHPSQRTELQSRDVSIRSGARDDAVPFPFNPGAWRAFLLCRIREQARVQIESRSRNVPVFELLQPSSPKRGSVGCRTLIGRSVFWIWGRSLRGDAGVNILFGLVSLGR